jgi:ketosteroid isomerase-like protein
MAQFSRKIRDLVSQFHAAATNADIDFIDEIVSQKPETIAIGSDPSEVFIGHDEIVGWWEDIFVLLDGGLPTSSPGPVQVNVRLGTAWVTDLGEWNLFGDIVPFRSTFVFLREVGGWKIIQQHFSIGVGNPDP